MVDSRMAAWSLDWARPYRAAKWLLMRCGSRRISPSAHLYLLDRVRCGPRRQCLGDCLGQRPRTFGGIGFLQALRLDQDVDVLVQDCLQAAVERVVEHRSPVRVILARAEQGDDLWLVEQ